MEWALWNPLNVILTDEFALMPPILACLFLGKVGINPDYFAFLLLNLRSD